MRSLRLDPELDTRVRRAAAMKGESISAFIRRSVSESADRALSSAPAEQFSDVIGVVHGGGGRAQRTGAAFTEALVENRRQRRGK